MRSLTLPLSSFAFIVATRAALGLGVGLLASTRLPARRRQTVGAALLVVGAATTVPAVMEIVRGRQRWARNRRAPVEKDRHLIGATRFPRKGNEVDADSIW
jgi:hypothetical protein